MDEGDRLSEARLLNEQFRPETVGQSRRGEGWMMW